MSPDAVMPASLADTVLGDRLGWFLGCLRGRAPTLIDLEVTDTIVTEPPAVPAPMRRGMLIHFAQAVGQFRVEGWENPRDDFAVARLRDAKGRRWRAWVQLAAERARRVQLAIVCMDAPPGYVVRPARADDASALRELERRSPIVTGAMRTTYDRGDDYFAGARLTGGITGTVAEHDGAIVAMHCMLTHELQIAGLRFAATYLHHSRLAPDAQGAGLFSALNGAELERHARDSKTFYSYVAVGNEAALRIVPVPPWSVQPERLVIECRTVAGAAHGRPATEDDADHVVRLVNAAHEREELFVPYTVDRLRARLEREPRLYGWSHVLIADDAVVGVRPARLTVRRESGADVEESMRALVADFGFAAGGETRLVALIRAWCARLHAEGITHLTLFTSPGSPGYDVLRPLAARVEAYYFNIGITEPADLARRGLYVDHLYF